MDATAPGSDLRSLIPPAWWAEFEEPADEDNAFPALFRLATDTGRHRPLLSFLKLGDPKAKVPQLREALDKPNMWFPPVDPRKEWFAPSDPHHQPQNFVADFLMEQGKLVAEHEAFSNTGKAAVQDWLDRWSVLRRSIALTSRSNLTHLLSLTLMAQEKLASDALARFVVRYPSMAPGLIDGMKLTYSGTPDQWLRRACLAEVIYYMVPTLEQLSDEELARVVDISCGRSPSQFAWPLDHPRLLDRAQTLGWLIEGAAFGFGETEREQAHRWMETIHRGGPQSEDAGSVFTEKARALDNPLGRAIVEIVDDGLVQAAQTVACHQLYAWYQAGTVAHLVQYGREEDDMGKLAEAFDFPDLIRYRSRFVRLSEANGEQNLEVIPYI